jgi:hypothetical protein
VSTAVAEPVLDLDLEKAIPCWLFEPCQHPAAYRIIFRPLKCSHRSMLACTACKDTLLAHQAASKRFIHVRCGDDAELVLTRIEAL